MYQKIKIRNVRKTPSGSMVFYRVEKIVDGKNEFVAVEEPLFVKDCTWEEGEEVFVPARVRAEGKKDRSGAFVKKKNGELLITISISPDSWAMNKEEEK